MGNHILSRMITKDENGNFKESILIEQAYVRQVEAESNKLKKQVSQLELEARLQKIDEEALRRELDEYKNNFLCKAIMAIKHFFVDLSAKIQERKPIKHQFDLVVQQEDETEEALNNL